MTVREIAALTGFSAAALPQPERVADGVYIGDLLSWVMGRAREGNVWITIMSNQNVAAVAVLCDTACIILSENVQPDAELLERAEKQGVTLLGSEMDEYQLCWRMKALLG